jgi:hypothetical protein
MRMSWERRHTEGIGGTASSSSIVISKTYFLEGLPHSKIGRCKIGRCDLRFGFACHQADLLKIRASDISSLPAAHTNAPSSSTVLAWRYVPNPGTVSYVELNSLVEIVPAQNRICCSHTFVHTQGSGTYRHPKRALARKKSMFCTSFTQELVEMTN